MASNQLSDAALAGLLHGHGGSLLDLCRSIERTHGVTIAYRTMRKIACGDRRPKVRRILDELDRDAQLRAQRAARAAVEHALATTLEICNDEKAGAYSRLRAAELIWKWAFDADDRADADAAGGENVILLAEVYESLAADRSQPPNPALGSDSDWQPHVNPRLSKPPNRRLFPGD